MPLPTDDEWRGFLPQIEQIAETVGRRTNASPTVRDELVASAVAHVYERITHFDPQQSAFRTWCWTVLKNHCISLIRREAVQRKRMQGHVDYVAHEHAKRLLDDPSFSPLEAQEYLADEARRPRLDIVRVLEENLQPIDRILLVGYAGLCAACGDSTLARWCVEAGDVDAAALTAIEALAKTKRKKALAGLLGEKVDWVRQRIYRATVLLKECDLGRPDA